ncbi:MAG: YraN family protein [Pseudomonadota bacterium]|nr:YraN family protein [Pseudomonadota bacterium]
MSEVIDRRRRGAGVEAAARTYLLRAGLREVAANANYRFGELDLVMLDDGRLDHSRLDDSRLDDSGRGGATLVFVEVRYRRSAYFGGGAASVDAGKRRKLVRAAQAFLITHRQFADTPCRFDVIEAEGDPDAPRLNWLRDAFRADDG